MSEIVFVYIALTFYNQQWIRSIPSQLISHHHIRVSENEYPPAQVSVSNISLSNTVVRGLRQHQTTATVVGENVITETVVNTIMGNVNPGCDSASDMVS